MSIITVVQFEYLSVAKVGQIRNIFETGSVCIIQFKSGSFKVIAVKDITQGLLFCFPFTATSADGFPLGKESYPVSLVNSRLLRPRERGINTDSVPGVYDPKLCEQRNDEGEGFLTSWSTAGAKIGYFCLSEFLSFTNPFGVKGQ
jgi:hypothetical protein